MSIHQFLLGTARALLLAALGITTLPALAQGSFQQASLGGLDYWVYTPSGYTGAAPVPLVVYLHGCTESAPNVAIGTRWNSHAEQHGFVVLYPDQRSDANPLKCWNWFSPANQGRDKGEAKIIADMTRKVMAERNIDPRRVYVLGASAGAAMTTVMAVSYPDIYAAAGMLAGCGDTACLDLLGRRGYQSMGPYARVVPAFIAAGTLDPVYFGALDNVLQWLGTADYADDGRLNLSISRLPAQVQSYPSTADSYAYTVMSYRDRSGRTVVDFHTAYGARHSYLGGDTSQPFTDAKGPAITPTAYEFFMAHPLP